MEGTELLVEVSPTIPARIGRLEELANNLWYAWERPARELFGPLDPELWDQVGHNPKLFLQRVNESKLNACAQDPVFLGRYQEVLSAFDNYLEHQEPEMSASALQPDDLVAYFCAEYGLHESVPIYSGGLGVLAGDHCKTASDLRLRFVAVGLLYRAGYFSQQIDAEGRQIARFMESSLEHLPISPVLDAEGKPIVVGVPIARRVVHAQLWELLVGHTRIVLLDTNVADNAVEDRDITYQLYGGGHEMRIQQEIVLGVGGVLALNALGLKPTVWHANEGHAAFMVLARAGELVDRGASFAAALEQVAASTVFTTHTPVPAGHDHFPHELVSSELESYFEALGVTYEEFRKLGRLDQEKDGDFNMTALALHGSRFHNGVSQIHGGVSAEICAAAWPEVPAEENPMGYITNGVHLPTFLSPRWTDLLERFLGRDWRARQCDADFWQGVEDIPDHLFWSVRQTIKSDSLYALREALREQYGRNQVSEPHIRRMLRFLDPNDPNVLTVGFARRFATYKRGTLLFKDCGWLEHILSNADQPVVFIFAGKAHPADEPGQQLMREVHELTNHPAFVGKVLLLEGYDIGLARRLVAGVDVWLNTPVYPQEASGTSGMKAAINGVLNLSVADGWWAEGFDGDNGWSISPSRHMHDIGRRDHEDARTLYEILQDEVLPTYYDRGKYGLSASWIVKSKRAMATMVPQFNMSRVLNDYIEQLYVPASELGARLSVEDGAAASGLADWKKRVRSAWPGVRLTLYKEPRDRLLYGTSLELQVCCDLNGLAPDDVVVELLLRPTSETDLSPVGGGFTAMDSHHVSDVNRGDASRAHRLEPVGQTAEGEHVFRVSVTPESCGRLGLKVRAYPYHRDLAHRFDMGMMRWL